MIELLCAGHMAAVKDALINLNKQIGFKSLFLSQILEKVPAAQFTNYLGTNSLLYLLQLWT